MVAYRMQRNPMAKTNNFSDESKRHDDEIFFSTNRQALVNDFRVDNHRHLEHGPGGG